MCSPRFLELSFIIHFMFLKVEDNVVQLLERQLLCLKGLAFCVLRAYDSDDFLCELDYAAWRGLVEVAQISLLIIS